MSGPRCVGAGIDFSSITSDDHSNYTAGRHLCAECPAAGSCLAGELAAMRVGAVTLGMFAGTLPHQRRRMLREEAKASKTAPRAGNDVVDPAGLDRAVASHPSTFTKPKMVYTKLKPIRHGEPSGAQMHRRRGETPCEACAEAWRKKVAEGQRERRARLKAVAATSDKAAAA